MPGGVFVDSSAWIALISRSDGRHRDARPLFEAALRKRIPLLTTNLVLAEVHRLQVFRVGPQAGARFLDRIDASPALEVVFPGRGHHERARAWLARLADQRVSYTDAVSFAVMDVARCTAALAFDRHFDLAGFRLWRSPR